MPIYEFRCADCGHQFEFLALGSDDRAEIKCPACSCPEISRVMSSCSSVITGGGAASPGAGRPKGGASLESRTCGKSDSCATITLPGPD